MCFGGFVIQSYKTKLRYNSDALNVIASRKRNIELTFFHFCRKRYRPKNFLVKLFKNNNRSGKFNTFSILFKSNIFSKATPPYFTLVKKWPHVIIMNTSFFITPLLKVFLHFSNIKINLGSPSP